VREPAHNGVWIKYKPEAEKHTEGENTNIADSEEHNGVWIKYKPEAEKHTEGENTNIADSEEADEELHHTVEHQRFLGETPDINQEIANFDCNMATKDAGEVEVEKTKSEATTEADPTTTKVKTTTTPTTTTKVTTTLNEATTEADTTTTTPTTTTKVTTTLNVAEANDVSQPDEGVTEANDVSQPDEGEATTEADPTTTKVKTTTTPTTTTKVTTTLNVAEASKGDSCQPNSFTIPENEQGVYGKRLRFCGNGLSCKCQSGLKNTSATVGGKLDWFEKKCRCVAEASSATTSSLLEAVASLPSSATTSSLLAAVLLLV